MSQMTQAHRDTLSTLAAIETGLAQATSRQDLEVLVRQTADLVAALGGYYQSRLIAYQAEQAMTAYLAVSQLESELHRVVLPFLHGYEGERTTLGLMRLLRLLRQAWELL
jgi:hypothetical protein